MSALPFPLINTSPQFHRLFMTCGPGLGYSAALDQVTDESQFGIKPIVAFINQQRSNQEKYEEP